MIKKLYECGCFDYRKFILSHQKELLLSSYAANILAVMLDVYNEDKYFTTTTIKNKLVITDEEFDLAITSLLEREYYSIYLKNENGVSKEAVSLDGFFTRVSEILDGVDPKDLENEFFQITQLLQREFNRVLTSDELDIVSSLIADEKATVSDIEDAVEYMKGHYKNVTMKNLVNSLNRFRTAPKEKEELPDYVKDFFKSIK